MNEISKKTMLIGLGAQKSGTTWLYEYLYSHPQIYLSPIKEMHVFDHRHVYSADNLRNLLMKRIRNVSEVIAHKKGKGCEELYDSLEASFYKTSIIDDIKRYIPYFEHRVSAESVFGEITPAYSLLPREGFQEIISLHPNVKFIFIMRDPIKRAWSHINDEMSRKGLTLSDEEKIKCIYSSSEENAYYQKSNYKNTIEVLESSVDKKDVLYLFYENLFTNDSVMEICDFLSVDFIEADFGKRVNQGSYSNIDIYKPARAGNIYTQIYSFCAEKFSAKLPSSWFNE